MFIVQALDCFVTHCDEVSLMTAVKMMTFGINLGYENFELNGKVTSRVLDNLSELNIKDVLSLTNFISRSSQCSMELLLFLKGELSRFYDSASTINEIVGVLNCLSFMSITEIYRLEVIQPFFDAMQGVDPDEVSLAALPGIAERMVRNLNHPNSEALVADIHQIHR